MALDTDSREEILWDAFRADDRKSGERLFELLRRPIAAICWAVCHERGLVEDAVQEASLRLVGGSPGFKEGRRLRPWAYQIARNAARDVLRRARDRGLSPTPYGEPSGSTHVESFLSRDEAHAVAQQIQGLPESLREAVILKYGLELENASIAEVLDISLDALRARLSRARSALRRRFHD